MDGRYSSQRKKLQPPRAYDGAAYANPNGELDVKNLSQTSALAERSIQPPVGYLRLPYDIKVSLLLPQIRQCMGRLELTNGTSLGSAVLISANCALVARHCIETIPLSSLRIRFNYFHNHPHAPPCATTASVNSIIEDDVQLDYAVVTINHMHCRASIPALEYIQPHSDVAPGTELILLHHPLGKPLRASIQGIDTRANATNYLLTLHDSDFGSSGGAYFNAKAELVALHLGSQIEEQDRLTFNVWRYALPISTIITSRPNSFITKLATGRLSGKTRFIGPNCQALAAANYPIPFIEIEMKPKRAQQKKAGAHAKKVSGAISRTDKRLAKHPTSQYQKQSVRELIAAFPELGASALDKKNQGHTSTNKTTFTNPNTSWSVVYDKRGEYNTVTNAQEHYVALDGSTSANGQDAKFHFRNKD